MPTIKLKVVGQDSNIVHFMVKQTTKMRKLKKSYSQRVGAPVAHLKFLFDGHRIKDEETPEALEMEQNDMIEAHQMLPGWTMEDDPFPFTFYISPEGKRFRSLQAANKFISFSKKTSDNKEETKIKGTKDPSRKELEGKTKDKMKRIAFMIEDQNLRKFVLLQNTKPERKTSNKFNVETGLTCKM